MNTLNFKDGKRDVQVVAKKGDTMGACATFNKKYICCNVQVLRSVHNCPFECSYCFLQNYLNNGATRSVHDIDSLMEEVRANISRQPQRLFRIGTWELGDSLALEEWSGQAARLIQAFADLNNAVLELKTKSACVDPILALEHKGRTVVSWSLNTEYIIQTEEHRTASLNERLSAMNKSARAGYMIGLHFDPMILYAGWENDYEKIVDRVFNTISPERVAWISMGSLRFNPEMKKKMENNYPDSKLTCAEMVLGDDAKMRYVKPLRVNMYKLLYSALQRHISENDLIYLCMERWDVWDKVFGYHPDSIEHLDRIFSASLRKKFGLP